MAVGRLQGVSKISGEVKSRTLTVEFEPTVVTVEAIQQALNAIAYDSAVLE